MSEYGYLEWLRNAVGKEGFSVQVPAQVMGNPSQGLQTGASQGQEAIESNKISPFPTCSSFCGREAERARGHC